jgi:hypothetical protein
VDYSVYSGAKLSEDVICGSDIETCVEGEQYFSIRSTYPQSDVVARINEYALYLNDEWQFSRFKLGIGARLTNDDYMNNTNLSPRTLLEYDVFDNGNTLLAAGYSRYYSSNLLSNKLREGMLPSIKNVRGLHNYAPRDWGYTDNQTFSEYNFKDLKTPYSDEYTLGIEQNIFDNIININYIYRDSGDEFARDYVVLESDGRRHWRLNNNGSSTYTSVQLKWSKSWKNHSFMANTTWSESRTSNENYDSYFGLDDLDTDVFLDGKRIKLSDLPKDNFNKPYVINAAYYGRFFEHLTVSAALKYTTAHTMLSSEDDVFVGYGEIDPDTGVREELTLASYSTAKIKDSYTLDCTFAWEQKTFDNQTLTVTLEVQNILDLKNKIGEGSRTTATQGYYTYDIYQMGRQFWLGLSYTF